MGFNILWRYEEEFEEDEVRIRLSYREDGYDFLVISNRDELEDTDPEDIIDEHFEENVKDSLDSLVDSIKTTYGFLKNMMPDNEIILSFDTYDNWPDQINPEKFYDFLIDKISEKINEDFEDNDMEKHSDKDFDYEEDETGEIEDLNNEIPGPEYRDHPKYTSTDMEALRDDRTKQAIKVLQAIKTEIGEEPKVMNTFNDPSNPAAFQTRHEFKRRVDVEMISVENNKKATVTIFTKI